jgi:hypothetical protein
MDVLAEVTALISPIKGDSPKIHRALTLLAQQLHTVTLDLEPLVQQSTLADSSTGTAVPPSTFDVTFTGKTIRFNWAQSTGAAFYEVRLGSSWDTASFVFRSVNLEADIDPLLVGTYTYLIKAVDSDNNYSSTATSVTFTIPALLAVTLNGTVIDNNILLYWTEPTVLFDIDYYEVFKDGVSLGNTTATFATRFEGVSGTYIYSVIGHDLAGNQTANAQLSLAVRQPPDYILQATQISALGGTLSSVIAETSVTPKKLVGPTDTSRTWAQHFTDNAWTTIQNQIDAGFPIYSQPAKITGTPHGYYEEVIDFGTTFSSTIATITFNYNQLYAGHDVLIVIKMATSTDNITYSAFGSGASQYLTNMRYLKFRIEFTAADNKALIEVFNVTTSLQVKREDDGGEIDAVSTDATGTSVSFNKAFKDIDKITATAKATTQYTVVVDFVDVPNPTGFSVYVFNAAGARASKRVEWHARGIL